MNVEGMYSIFFIKEMERSDSILRNSLFGIRYSAVRCLIQAIAAASLITKKPCHFGVVSYEPNLEPLNPEPVNVYLILFYPPTIYRFEAG